MPRTDRYPCARVTGPATPGLRGLPAAVLALLAAVVLMAALAAPSPAQATQSADPAAEAYVADLGSRAISIFGADNVSSAEERAKFRALLLDALDLKRVGLFALGQYARLPTPEQRETYFKLIEDFIVEVYYGRLSGYSNEQFVVTGSIKKGDAGREVIVTSEIRFADGRDPLPVQWWLIRSEDGSFKVFDVNVAGIWMAQEQRGTFTSIIRNNGGRFEALLDHLRQQIEKARAEHAEADKAAAAR